MPEQQGRYMVFSSLIFLFAFLPVALTLYFTAPSQWRNGVLLAVSLIFYAWGEPSTVLLMLFSIASAFVFGVFIEKYKEIDRLRAKRMMVASLAISLSILFFFKYYNFFAENISRAFFIPLPRIDSLRLPIGISFYTFQIMSYTVDLWRGDCRLQKSIVSFGTYVTLFPQLIAGPIVRYRDIDRQLNCRRESLEAFCGGVLRFCCGLGKKVIIGDSLALASRYFEELAFYSNTVVGAWMTAVFFTLHLYYDFSGYSDMAIGLGRMLGFDFLENFRYPYVSKSITEFWRRWHISLSLWFREYVYIPLGGNRVGKWRQYRNLAIVWVLTGFWHGAAWNFLLWGAYFAVILILEKAYLLKVLAALPSTICHLYTMLLVVVGFLIFHFSDLDLMIAFLKALVGIGCDSFSGDVVGYQLLRLLPLFLIASVGATPYPKRWMERLTQKMPNASRAYPVLSLGVLLLCVAYLVDSTFSPFAYLQF